jgi:hypothetical protein
MSFDDIMAKYLDGSISVDEQKELNDMMMQNPELREQYTNLTSLEKQLDKSKTVLYDTDLAFLSSYKESMFNKTNSDKAPIISNGSFLSSNLNLLVSALVIILGVGSVAYYFNTNSTVNKMSVSQKAEPQKVIAPHSTQQLLTETQSTEVQTSPSKSKEIKETENNYKVTSPKESELKAQINQSTSLKNQDLIDKIRFDLTNYEKQNDLLNQAISLKKLGVIYRDGEKLLIESREYLNKALQIALASKSSEVTAEIYGELGLLEKKSGNINLAQNNIEKCIEMLRESKPERVKYWQKSLDKIKL